MNLPAPLRAAVERVLDGLPAAELAAAATELSEGYRRPEAVGSRRAHVADNAAARAYLATRLPATYAAVSAALAAAAAARPEFAPHTLLDAGAGPGTATWAAAQLWPELATATLVEASAAMRAAGAALGMPEGVAASWIAADLAAVAAPRPDARDAVTAPADADLVVLAYVLGEVAEPRRHALVDQLWQRASDLLVIVEPGTPAGWQRVLDARARLVAAGAHIVAPCPHAHPCPLAAPDWCHFAQRLDRSRLHRLAKNASVPWEDEKFSYVVADRRQGAAVAGRVIAPPVAATGRVALKLCKADGAAAIRQFTRREGDAYRVARRLAWGDVAPAPDA